jgi:hypothetical protein
MSFFLLLNPQVPCRIYRHGTRFDEVNADYPANAFMGLSIDAHRQKQSLCTMFAEEIEV